MVDVAVPELGERGVIFGLDAEQKIFDRPVVHQIGVGATFLDPANAARIAREGFEVRFTDRVHMIFKRRGIEIPQMHLRDIMVERHDATLRDTPGCAARNPSLCLWVGLWVRKNQICNQLILISYWR